MTYRRLLEGRWYPRGVAQLQNSKKEIRNLALRGKGIGIDLRASFPSILAGLISENVRERGTTFEMKETHRMLRDLKSWNADVARELSINSARVKEGVNAIAIQRNRFEKEVQKARVLIAEEKLLRRWRRLEIRRLGSYQRPSKKQMAKS